MSPEDTQSTFISGSNEQEPERERTRENIRHEFTYTDGASEHGILFLNSEVMNDPDAYLRESVVPFLHARQEKERLEILARAADKEAYLGHEAERMERHVRELVGEYLRLHGIEKVIDAPVVLTDSESLRGLGRHYAGEYNCETRTIEVAGYPIDDPEIRTLQFLDSLAHEMYHSRRSNLVIVHRIDDAGEGHSIISSDAPFAFISPHEGEVAKEEFGILEEGYAVDAQLWVFSRCQGHVSKEQYETYDRIVHQAHDGPLALIGWASTEQNDKDVVQVTVGRNAYGTCKKICEIMEDAIPGFRTLYETSQTASRKRERDTAALELDQKIRAVFGNEIARMLRTTEPKDSKKVTALWNSLIESV